MGSLVTWEFWVIVRSLTWSQSWGKMSLSAPNSNKCVSRSIFIARGMTFPVELCATFRLGMRQEIIKQRSCSRQQIMCTWVRLALREVVTAPRGASHNVMRTVPNSNGQNNTEPCAKSGTDYMQNHKTEEMSRGAGLGTSYTLKAFQEFVVPIRASAVLW